MIEVEKPKEITEKIEAIDNEIKKLLEASEKLGDEGKLEESEQIMLQVETFKKKKEELILLGEASVLGSGKNQKVRNRNRKNQAELLTLLSNHI